MDVEPAPNLREHCFAGAEFWTEFEAPGSPQYVGLKTATAISKHWRAYVRGSHILAKTTFRPSDLQTELDTPPFSDVYAPIGA